MSDPIKLRVTMGVHAYFSKRTAMPEPGKEPPLPEHHVLALGPWFLPGVYEVIGVHEHREAETTYWVIIREVEDAQHR